MAVRTGPILAIASTPRSGREPCAARPCVTTSKAAKPLWATQSCSSVGSATMAPSAFHARTSAVVPRLPTSSSITAVTTTSPRSSSSSARLAATIVAASAPFMSYAPRPYRRLSSRRASPGRSIASIPTVSVCAFSSRVRPPPLPRATPTTFGRFGAASSMLTSRPARSSQSATKPATSASPRAPEMRSGLTESIATSARASSATSLTPCRRRVPRTRSRRPRPRPSATAPRAAPRRRCGPRRRR